MSGIIGGGPGARRQIIPKDDPAPEPVMTDEVIAAKDRTKVKAGKRGRGRNILAGRMMQERQVLNTGKRQLGA